MSGPYKKGPWSRDEDERLKDLISPYQDHHEWTLIAAQLGNTRSPKQCRERYTQNLNPNLRHTAITEEEGRYILEQVRRRGTRWAEISRLLQGRRCENQLKNWYNGQKNKASRQAKKMAERRQAAEQRHAAEAGSANSSTPRTLAQNDAYTQYRTLSRLSPDLSERAEVTAYSAASNYSISRAAISSQSRLPRFNEAFPEQFATQGQLLTAPSTPVLPDLTSAKPKGRQMSIDAIMN